MDLAFKPFDPGLSFLNAVKEKDVHNSRLKVDILKQPPPSFGVRDAVHIHDSGGSTDIRRRSARYVGTLDGVTDMVLGGCGGLLLSVRAPAIWKPTAGFTGMSSSMTVLAVMDCTPEGDFGGPQDFNVQFGECERGMIVDK